MKTMSGSGAITDRLTFFCQLEMTIPQTTEEEKRKKSLKFSFWETIVHDLTGR